MIEQDRGGRPISGGPVVGNEDFGLEACSWNEPAEGCAVGRDRRPGVAGARGGAGAVERQPWSDSSLGAA